MGAVALGGMEKEELKGLDISVFSRAPPQALLTTLEHLRCPLLADRLRYMHVDPCTIKQDHCHMPVSCLYTAEPTMAVVPQQKTVTLSALKQESGHEQNI